MIRSILINYLSHCYQEEETRSAENEIKWMWHRSGGPLLLQKGQLNTAWFDVHFRSHDEQATLSFPHHPPFPYTHIPLTSPWVLITSVINVKLAHRYKVRESTKWEARIGAWLFSVLILKHLKCWEQLVRICCCKSESNMSLLLGRMGFEPLLEVSGVMLKAPRSVSSV